LPPWLPSITANYGYISARCFACSKTNLSVANEFSSWCGITQREIEAATRIGMERKFPRQ
jgi:hypothetical protein